MLAKRVKEKKRAFNPDIKSKHYGNKYTHRGGIDMCIKIHSKIGPGCFEKVYEEVLYHELIKAGLKVERQLLLPVRYDDMQIDNAYKLDLLVEDMLVLELKSVYPLPPVFFKQIRTQLSLLNLKNGMLLNFKVELMKDGIHRVFNNFGKDRL